MKKALFLFLILIALMISLQGCASFSCNVDDSALDDELKKLKVPAVLAVTPEGKFIALKLDGQEAKRCSVPEEGKPIQKMSALLLEKVLKLYPNKQLK